MNSAVHRTPIDAAAREAALDMQHSVIVQAPAGSGKTTLLCRRFLAALAQVEQPEKILAITFTRKAAQEMRERIERYLHDPLDVDAQKVLQQDKKFHWQLDKHPERLSIMTIDGLCARIVEQAPITSGIYGYQISPTPIALYQHAVEMLFEDIDHPHPWQQAFHALLLDCHNQWHKLYDLFVELLAKREQWLRLLPEMNEPAEWRTRLEKNLQACLQQAIEAVDQHIPLSVKQQLFSLIQFAQSQSSVWNDWRTLVAWPEPSIENEALWRILADFLLTKDSQWRKVVDKRFGFPVGIGSDRAYYAEQKKAVCAILAGLGAIPGLFEALCMMKQAPQPRYSASQWQRVLVTLSVLHGLLAYWHITIQEKKQVDFTEVTLRALATLGSDEAPTELALSLDYRIQHILVDEFQDTSLLHYELLEQLTRAWQDGDGHTLFLVGDPLQSIYRFRQAEVGLFLRAWTKGFAQLNLQAIQLQQNFRASAHLVDFYNEYLAQILPKISTVHEGAVAYYPVTAVKPALLTQAVSFIGCEDTQSQSAAEACAQQLIVDVQRIQNNMPEATLAILVRSRSHLLELLPMLHAAQMDYQARDLTQLIDQPVVTDLLSWLQALLNIEDRLSWLAMLHMPALNVPLSFLQTLFEQDTRLVWQRLLAWRMEHTSETDDARDETTALQKIITAWQEALEQLQRKPLDHILYTLWTFLSAASYWSDAVSQQATEQFFSLLQEHQTGGDVIDFALFKSALALRAFSSQQSTSRLEIMTMHKAKGLEFDVVFLPALDRPAHASDQPLLLFDEIILAQGPVFLLAPPRNAHDGMDTIFNFLWGVQKNKNNHERLRLLYVACTRAKQALYFYAQVPCGEEVMKNPRHGSFLADLRPIWASG